MIIFFIANEMLDNVLIYDEENNLTSANKIFTIQLYALYDIITSDINLSTSNILDFDPIYDAIDCFVVESGKLVCQQSNTYLLRFSLSVDSTSLSNCIISIKKNAVVIAQARISSESCSCQCIVALGADDEISIVSTRQGLSSDAKIILEKSSSLLISKINV
jgi:hypothetical protein